MKKKSTYSVKLFPKLLVVLVISLSACGQQNAKTNQTASEAQTQEIKAPDTPLQAAVFTGNLNAVQQHIAAGTDLNVKDPMSGATPLMTAITFDKTAIAKALVEGGADLSITNADGSTALHTAAFFCRVEAVQLLLDAGADKGIRNNYGATARETVLAPFADMKPIYEMMQQQLSPMGLQLDLAEVEKTRPTIGVMLQ